VAKQFDVLMKSRSFQVVVPPSILIEVTALPVAEVRQRIIYALATGPRNRLPTEAQSEAWEVVSEIKRFRPHWMRSMPDTARVWSLNNYWTNRIWRQALQDSQRLHAIRVREERVYDYLVKQQRDQRRRMIQANFKMRPLTAIRFTATPEAPDSYLAGWSGDAVEAWRITSRDLYWHALSIISGRAVITKEDTTYADWVGSYVELSRLRSSHTDFTRFWLDDVALSSVPRNWLRWAVNFAQSNYKITGGNPSDEQHSAYLLDCDLFLSADAAYIRVLELVREDSPFTLAEPRLVSGDRTIPILDRLMAAL